MIEDWFELLLIVSRFMLIACIGCEIEWVCIQIGVDWLNCGGWLITKLCCFGFQSWNVAFVCCCCSD